MLGIITKFIKLILRIITYPIRVALAPIIGTIKLIYSFIMLIILILVIGMILGYIPIPSFVPLLL